MRVAIDAIKVFLLYRRAGHSLRYSARQAHDIAIKGAPF